MTWHLFVHYLDNVRAATASSCVGGPESLVEVLVGVVVWNRLLGPRIRRWHAREQSETIQCPTPRVAARRATPDAPVLEG